MIFVVQIAVQVLEIIQEILPPVTSLCIQEHSTGSDGTDSKSKIYNAEPVRHYAVVESEHPYKPASVNNYRVNLIDILVLRAAVIASMITYSYLLTLE